MSVFCSNIYIARLYKTGNIRKT